MKAKEFDEKFEKGGNVISYLDLSKARILGVIEMVAVALRRDGVFYRFSRPQPALRSFLAKKGAVEPPHPNN